MRITFTWIGGATWVLRCGDMTIAADPVLCPKGHVQDYGFFKTTRCDDPRAEAARLDEADLWLLTHGHEDHCDRPGRQMIAPESTICAHRSLKPLLGNVAARAATYLAWGESMIHVKNGIEARITAIPAYHARRRMYSALVGNGNGYVVSLRRDDARFLLYVTGDSVFGGPSGRDTRAVQSAAGAHPIDLILANAGSATVGTALLSRVIGRITNNREDLKALAGTLRPRVLIPVHWGTFSHYREAMAADDFLDTPAIRVMAPGESAVLLHE